MAAIKEHGSLPHAYLALQAQVEQAEETAVYHQRLHAQMFTELKAAQAQVEQGARRVKKLEDSLDWIRRMQWSYVESHQDFEQRIHGVAARALNRGEGLCNKGVSGFANCRRPKGHDGHCSPTSFTVEVNRGEGADG